MAVKVTKLFPKRLQARDSGHNHQGVNSLAHSQSLLKQTGELGYQSSSEDFCFEPWTFSPWLSGPSEGSIANLHLAYYRFTARRVGIAHH